jgi:hypothetical protein
MLLPVAGAAHTITFDNIAGIGNSSSWDGPYIETDDGVTLTLTANVHLHQGGWSG